MDLQFGKDGQDLLSRKYADYRLVKKLAFTRKNKLSIIGIDMISSIHFQQKVCKLSSTDHQPFATGIICFTSSSNKSY